MRTPTAIHPNAPQPADPTHPLALASTAVLIPAWQPAASLVSLVDDLLAAGFTALVVVDDGSSPHLSPFFNAIAHRPGVHLLHHAINLGKGRALKTGMNHILATMPACATVVTADADGQHIPADILRVALAAQQLSQASSGDTFILGVRTFSRSVPLPNRLGNTLTRALFGCLTGTKLADTQTGLRAFSRTLLPQLLSLQGERYEYEMTVLAHLCRSAITPLQLPIETLYLDRNRSSRFHPIRDSLRIYRVLARVALQRIPLFGRPPKTA